RTSGPLKPSSMASWSTAIQPFASGTIVYSGTGPHGVPGGGRVLGGGVGPGGEAPDPAICTLWKAHTGPLPVGSHWRRRLPTMTGQTSAGPVIGTCTLGLAGSM